MVNMLLFDRVFPRTKVIVILIFLLCSINCNHFSKDQIYKAKGYDDAKANRLIPEIYHPGKNVYHLVEVELENKVAAWNFGGDICYVDISKFGFLSFNKPILSDFPDGGARPGPGWNLYSDGNVIWTVWTGGSIALLDIPAKTTFDLYGVHYNESQIFLADHDKKTMFVRIHQVFDDMGIEKYHGHYYYYLYDLPKNKKIFTSEEIKFDQDTRSHLTYQSLNNQLLINKSYFNKKGQPSKYHWYFSDLYSKKKYTNDLTKTLDKLQIESIVRKNEKKKMLLARAYQSIDDLGNSGYYIIHWDDEMENIRLKKLHFPFQIYPHQLTHIDSEFKWFVSFHYNPDTDDKTSTEEMVAFHIDEATANGINHTIKLGIFYKNSEGVFMKHAKWGTCFVVKENWEDIEDANTIYLFPLDKSLGL